jgi:hypothetical protein
VYGVVVVRREEEVEKAWWKEMVRGFYSECVYDFE